jgi:hypothetical protein
MTKALLTGFAMMLITICSYSQMGFGVRAGYNNSTIKTDSSAYDEVLRRGSFNVGLFLTFPVNDNFSVQTEVMFSGVGAWTITDRNLGTADDPRYEYTETQLVLNYLSIPIMAKYSIQAFNIQVGPQIGILGRALSKENYLKVDGSTAVSGEKTRDVQHFYRFFDFGFNAGLGAEVGRFQFTVRYSIGIANVANNGGRITNNLIQSGIGFRLSEDY